jgi:Family of unknown function (DUF6069)
MAADPPRISLFCSWWPALPTTTSRNVCLWGRLHLPHAHWRKSCNKESEHMSTSTLADRTERVATGRLLRVGALAIGASVVANLLIRIIFVNVLGIGTEFPPLGWGPPIIFTIMGVLGAIIVFAIIARFAKRPIRLFRIIGLVVLVLSLLPDIGLLNANAMPGTSLGAVIALMLMHVAAGAITIWLLTTRTVEL